MNVLAIGKWGKKQFGAIRVRAVPALHIAITRGIDIVAERKHIYFAGGMYYGEFMRDIGTRFMLDLPSLPVTTIRVPRTMAEKSAVRAVEALSPRTLIPISFGIYSVLPLLRTNETPTNFRKRIHAAGLRGEVRILPEGEGWEC
jgi:L-ascorbate metabolism protein UlaG (beta-lactamase superfamily)